MCQVRGDLQPEREYSLLWFRIQLMLWSSARTEQVNKKAGLMKKASVYPLVTIVLMHETEHWAQH